jgi:putative transposase
MESSHAKSLFEDVLVRAKAKFSFTIDNFVIMGNHYHLIIKPGPEESLSKLMQWIMSVYAMAYNRATGRTGHFWGERFFSRVLDSLQQFLKVFEYIDYNPQEARLVEDHRDWPFSGLAHHRSGKRHLIENVPAYLALLVSSHRQLFLPLPNTVRTE